MTPARIMTRGQWRDIPTWKRRDMTVCIAAICAHEDSERIVLCTDRKLSSSLGSTETGRKDLPIAHRWRLLTAGEEPEIIALHRLYRRRFHDINNLTPEKLDESVKFPLRQRKIDLSNDYTFSRYNMSYADFVAVGKEKFPDEEYRNSIRNVASISLSASLIIAGFVDDSSEIYYTDADGVSRAANDFAVIGEGAYIAQSALLRREQNSRLSLAETIYNVYEAKRYSESIGSVGEHTAISILAPGQRRELTSLNVDKQLEKHYAEYGPRRLPRDFKLDGPILFGEEQALKNKALE